MDADDAALPGVIVVAEPVLHELLLAQPVSWRVQDRQEGIAQMWENLSSGALDSYSRIVVFSDALREGDAADADELTQTAWATAAMAGAGARVFVAVWRPDQVEALDRQIVDAATAQGLDASQLDYNALPAQGPARGILDTLRDHLGAFVAFPDDWTGDVDTPLRRRPPAGLPLRPPGRPAAGLPLMPPGRPSEPEAPVVESAHSLLPPAEQEPADEPAAQPEWDDDGGSGDEDLAGGWHEPEHVEPHPGALAADDQFAFDDQLAADVEATAAVEPAADDQRRAVILDEGWLRPGLPPLGEVPPVDEAWSPDYPPQASRALLDRPVIDGQITLTVVSSKGGSGKTTVSVLLAAAIVRASTEAGRPLSVVVVDLDTYHGQVSSLVGAFMPTALNIRVQPAWDEDAIRHNLVFAKGLGIETLLAPIRPRTADILGPDFYRTMIRSLKRMYDVVLIDTGNHYLAPLVAEVALAESDEILFVTTLASTAVQGMARALHEITAPAAESGLGVPRELVGIVVNQAATEVGLDGDALVTAGLGVPIVGVVPLATRDVLTATNSSRMEVLLDHPLLGPAYFELARSCLPSRALAPWPGPSAATANAPETPALEEVTPGGGERRGLFRR